MNDRFAKYEIGSTDDAKASASKYGERNDGTVKGSGFLGELQMRDGSGKVATEMTVGVNIGGKETDIPMLVPTLTADEREHLLKGLGPTDPIVQKAVDHANSRIKSGKSVFADSPVQDAFAKYEVAQQQPADRFSKYEIEAQPAQPVRTLAISRNLENELRNVGVDPATMTVFRSDKDLGLVGKIGRWFRSGNAQMKMDWRMVEAANSDTDVYDQYKQEEQLYAQALALNPIEANGFWEKAFMGAATSLPGMGYSLAGKAVGAGTGLMAAAGAATLLTPGLPDEAPLAAAGFLARMLGKKVLTGAGIKSGIGKVGALAGGMAPYYFQGTGSLYRDMREAGLDHETAGTWARAGAVPYAGIEFINDYIPMSKVIPGLRNLAKPVVSKTITEAMLRTAGNLMWSTTKESSEEFFQEVSNEITKNIAYEIGGIPDAQKSAWQVFESGFSNMMAAIGPSLLLGGLPAAGFGIQQAKISKAYQAVASIGDLVGMDEQTAKYVTASLTGADIKELDSVMTKPQEDRIEALRAAVEAVNPGLVAQMLETKMKPEESQAVLDSPAPRAAFLAWQYDGMQGVNKVNEAFKTEEVVTDEKADQKADQEITAPSAAVAGQPATAVEGVKIDMPAEPVTGYAESPAMATVPSAPDVRVAEAEKTPVVPSVTPVALPEPKPVTVTDIDNRAINQRERDNLIIAKGQYHVPGLRLSDREDAGRMAYMVEKGEVTLDNWNNWVSTAKAENRFTDLNAPIVAPVPGVKQEAQPETFTAKKAGGKNTGKWEIPYVAMGTKAEMKALEGRLNKAGLPAKEVYDLAKNGTLDKRLAELEAPPVTPAAEPAPDQTPEPTVEPTQTPATPAPTAAPKPSSTPTSISTKQALDKAADQIIGKLKLSSSVKAVLNKKLVERVAERTGKAVGDVVQMMNRAEGMLVPGQGTEATELVLGMGASPFTVAHEMFHQVFDIVMQIPELATHVNGLFNSLAPLPEGTTVGRTARLKIPPAWSTIKMKDGRTYQETMMADIAKWQETGEMSVTMQELVARMVEQSVASYSDRYKITGAKRKTPANEFFDMLPTSVQEAFRTIAAILATMWGVVVGNKPNDQKQMYMSDALPNSNRIKSLTQQLLFFQELGMEDKDLVADVEAGIQPALDRHRAALVQAYSELDADPKKDKLTHVDSALLQPNVKPALEAAGYAPNRVGYIENLVDQSVILIREMAVNVALMQVAQAKKEVLRAAIPGMVAKKQIVSAKNPEGASWIETTVERIGDYLRPTQNVKKHAIPDSEIDIFKDRLRSFITDRLIPYQARLVANNFIENNPTSDLDINDQVFVGQVVASMTSRMTSPDMYNRLASTTDMESWPKHLRKRTTSEGVEMVTGKDMNGKEIEFKRYREGTELSIFTFIEDYFFKQVAGKRPLGTEEQARDLDTYTPAADEITIQQESGTIIDNILKPFIKSGKLDVKGLFAKLQSDGDLQESIAALKEDDLQTYTALAKHIALEASGQGFSIPAIQTGLKGVFLSGGVPVAQDREYMDAVERGDMDSAQRMVDEAAKRAGMIKAYHGTPYGGFVEFKPSAAMDAGIKTPAIFLSGGSKGLSLAEHYAKANDEDVLGLTDLSTGDKTTIEKLEVGESYEIPGVIVERKKDGWQFDSGFGWLHSPILPWKGKKQVYNLFVKHNNPIIYDAGGMAIGGSIADQSRGKAAVPLQSLVKQAKELGRTLIIRNTIDPLDGDVHVVFDPNQIKSADAITRDDAGNVIPLSKRFDPAQGDIRFSGAEPTRTPYATLERIPELSQTFANFFSKMVGSLSPEELTYDVTTIQEFRQQAVDYITGKTMQQVMDGISELRQPVQLAVAILLSGSGKTMQHRNLARQVFDLVKNIGHDAGQSLRLFQEFYESTHEGRMSLVNAVATDNLTIRRNLIKAEGKLRDMFNPLLKIVQGYAKELTDGDFQTIWEETLNKLGLGKGPIVIGDGPGPGPGRGPGPGPAGDAIGNAVSKLMREAMRRRVNIVMKKLPADPKCPFFSGVEESGQVDMGAIIGDFLENVITNDFEAFSSEQRRANLHQKLVEHIKKVLPVYSKWDDVYQNRVADLAADAIQGTYDDICNIFNKWAGVQSVEGEIAKESELTRLADEFADKIEAYAADTTSEIKMPSDKAALRKAISALMDIVKEKALVDKGKKSTNFSVAQQAQVFLQNLIGNTEAIQEIWEEAKSRFTDEESRSMEGFGKFVATALDTPFAKRQVTEALTQYLKFATPNEFPLLLRQFVDKSTRRLQNIADGVVDGLLAGEITEAQLEKAVEKIADKFANQTMIDAGVEPSLNDDAVLETLRTHVKETMMDWLSPHAKNRAVLADEVNKVKHAIVSEINRGKIRKNTNEGKLAAQMLKIFREFGIIEKGSPVAPSESDKAYQTLGIAVNMPMGMMKYQLIEDLNLEILKASTGEITTETFRMLSRARTMLKAIQSSEELRAYEKTNVLTSQVDTAISHIMAMYNRLLSDKKVMINMRALIHQNFVTKEKIVKDMTDAIVNRSGVDPLLAAQLTETIIERFNERLMKARQKEIENVMGRPIGKKIEIRDFTERVLERIHLGALETPDLTKRMAKYMGLETISEEARNELESFSKLMEERGAVVNRGRLVGPSEASPDIAQRDLWYNSSERRHMVKQFNAMIAKTKGSTWIDKTAALYFANLLSGMSTPEVNTISTISQNLSHNMARAVAVHIIGAEGGKKYDMTGFFHTIASMFSAIPQSTGRGFRMLRDGEVAGAGFSAYASMKHAAGIDPDMYKSKFMKKIAGVMKYVGRGLNAMDYANAHSSYVAFLASLARRKAVEIGATGTDLEIAERLLTATYLHRQSDFDVSKPEDLKAMKDMLRKLEGKIEPRDYAEIAARLGIIEEYAEQAMFELTGQENLRGTELQAEVAKLDSNQRFKYYSRIDELQYNALPIDMKEQLVRHTGLSTFNLGQDTLYDHTIIGKFTRNINNLRQEFKLLTFIMPFVTIVGRVVDMSMDYSILGLSRARFMANQMNIENSDTKFTRTDVETAKVKAYVGFATTTALAIGAIMSMFADDDDDDDFQITAKGSSDRNKANILRESRGYGFQEYSVRIGNKWFSYKYTPLAIPMVLIGSMMDYLRYDIGLRTLRKMPESERKLFMESPPSIMYNMVLRGATRALPGIFEQTYMNSISEFMEVLSTPNEEVRQSKVARLIGKMSTGVVVPNFAKQLMRSVDPSLYQTPDSMNTIVGEILRELPMSPAWKKNMLLQRYNVLGEPIRLTSPSISSSLIEMAVRDRENRPSNIGRFVTVGQMSDPTWTWLGAKDVRVPSVSTSEMIVGIPMTDEMRQKYAVYRGRIIKSILDRYTSTASFQSMSHGNAQKVVDEIVPQVSRAVKSAMIADPRIVRQLVDAKRPEIFARYGILLPDRK